MQDKSKKQMQGKKFVIKSEGDGKSCSKKTTFKPDFIGKYRVSPKNVP